MTQAVYEQDIRTANNDALKGVEYMLLPTSSTELQYKLELDFVADSAATAIGEYNAQYLHR